MPFLFRAQGQIKKVHISLRKNLRKVDKSRKNRVYYERSADETKCVWHSEKAETKRVGRRQKAQRAGEGGNPARVGFFEDHFRAADWKKKGFLGTDGFPPLQGDACDGML